MDTSLFGRRLTISANNFASSATMPSSSIVPSIVVSIPSSISFPVIVICPSSAVNKMHCKIGIVVFEDTAFETIETPF